MKRFMHLIFISFLCTSSLSLAQKFHIVRDGITLSGISSGGMAVQQEMVAFSDVYSGVGIFAAPPYGCSQGKMETIAGCLSGKTPTTQELVAATLRHHKQELVSDPTFLKDKRVFVFASKNDSLVHHSAVAATADYFRHFGSAVKFVDNIPTEHTFPTTDPMQQNCSIVKQPYVGDCGYDGSREVLSHLYGGNLKENAKTLSGRFVMFDQSRYTDSLTDLSLDKEGYLYVPKACDEHQSCRLHIALHGCDQNAQLIGVKFAMGAGYNAVADTNNIIVVYPQTIVGKAPYGCWDWFGYTDGNYETNQGRQARFLREIVRDFSGY